MSAPPSSKTFTVLKKNYFNMWQKRVLTVDGSAVRISTEKGVERREILLSSIHGVEATSSVKDPEVRPRSCDFKFASSGEATRTLTFPDVASRNAFLDEIEGLRAGLVQRLLDGTLSTALECNGELEGVLRGVQQRLERRIQGRMGAWAGYGPPGQGVDGVAPKEEEEVGTKKN